MFCLRSVYFCLLLAVVIDVSNSVHLNTENFIEVSGLKNLKEDEYRFLGFEEEFIETVAEDTFKKCVNARLVTLYNNPLTVISKNLFKYNKQLRMMYINNCQISTLHPDTFAAQASIVQLFLDQNYLTEIDEGLFRYNTNLTQLILSHNRLTEIKSNTFATLVYLKFIALDNNRLTSLPENLFALNPKLVEINMSANRFKVLPANLFKNNVNLKGLYLQKNRLSSFDLNVVLTNHRMTELGLYNNELTEIVFYDKLHQYWPQLSNISLTGNNFNCSYLHSIYDYCTEKGINVYVGEEEAAKHPADNLYNNQTCIEDKDFETVSVARINAPDAPYEDVPKIYAAPVALSETNDDLVSFFAGFAYIAKLLFIESFLGEQQACEEGQNDFNFLIAENCDNYVAY